MASNKVTLSGPSTRRWFTLYVHEDAESRGYRIFETYEDNGYEHYVNSKSIDIKKDDVRFKRVVLVSGKGISYQIIHSFLIWTGEGCRLTQYCGKERLTMMNWECKENKTIYKSIRVAVIASSPTNRELTSALGFTPVASGGVRPNARPSSSLEKKQPAKEKYSGSAPAPKVVKQTSNVSTSSVATTLGSTNGSAAGELENKGAVKKSKRRQKKKKVDAKTDLKDDDVKKDSDSTPSSSTVTDMNKSSGLLPLGDERIDFLLKDIRSIIPSFVKKDLSKGESNEEMVRIFDMGKDARIGLMDKKLTITLSECEVGGVAMLNLSSFDRVTSVPPESVGEGLVHVVDDHGTVYVVKSLSSAVKAKTDGKSFLLALV